MNHSTVQALHRINLDFYRARAAEFSATRRRPWPGWRRALEVYLTRWPEPRAGKVLDLGCGNGRLGLFLAPRLPGHFYLGVDASLGLLAEARRADSGFPRAGFAAADLLGGPWSFPAAAGGFSWIAVFGLVHHVAGTANRRRLLSRVGRLLAPGGLASVSFWQFADLPRFRRRVVAWSGVDRDQLEAGDHLLRWGAGDDRRFCHHVDDEEAAALVAASGLSVLDSYRSDGEGADLNLYYLLTR